MKSAMLIQQSRFLLPSLIVGLSLLVSSCGKSEQPAAAPDAKAVVITAKLLPDTLMTELPGRMEAYRRAEVRARAAGVVIEQRYKEGQEVRAGDVLFRIDPLPLRAALTVAKSAVARAQVEYGVASDKVERYKLLRAGQSISERDFTEAKADQGRMLAALNAAKAELQQANLNLSYADVVAPIAGRARRALVTEGALVGLDNSSTPLTNIEQIDPIYVNFSRPAAEVFAIQQAIRKGKLQSKGSADASIVHLILPDGSVYEHTGQLSFSDLAVDPNTDSVAMRALFPNRDRVLLPGGIAQVRMISAVSPNTVRIPREALLRTGQTAVVRIVNGQQKVEERVVKADIMQGRDWLVTEGLKGGERIIAESVAQYAVGQKVHVEERAVPATIAASAPAATPVTAQAGSH